MKKTLLALACVLAVGCGGSGQVAPPKLNDAQVKESTEQVKFGQWWKTQEQLMTMYFFTEYRIPATFTLKEVKFLDNYQTAAFYLVAKTPSETIPQLNIFVLVVKLKEQWHVASIAVKEEIEFQLNEMQKQQGQ